MYDRQDGPNVPLAVWGNSSSNAPSSSAASAPSIFVGFV